jgi:hypothetical protein
MQGPLQDGLLTYRSLDDQPPNTHHPSTRHPRSRAGPLIDAAAKERAALLMEYRGKLPAAQAAAAQQACERPLSWRELRGQRFQQLGDEVAEREAFLRDMQVGRGRACRAVRCCALLAADDQCMSE